MEIHLPNLTTNDRPQAEVRILFPSLSVMKHFTKPEVSTTCGFSTGLYGCGFTSHGRTPKARKFLSGKWAQKKNSHFGHSKWVVNEVS